ncbi:MAG: hypothetical protein CL675_06720 [Bdellovibrionaceae bacterium]|nr:hypothetical protein [Pseudobdellovibrionaceae bacterium]
MAAKQNTLEQYFYEYRPYVFALVGVWALMNANLGFGRGFGGLLLTFAVLIITLRHQARR